MNQPDFNTHLEAAIERTKKVLLKKRVEYNGETEVFHNFNDAAAGISLHNTNVAVAWEYLSKHLQSVRDMVVLVESRDDLKKLTPELLDEKFGDVINYFLLIEGMIREKIKS
jgi:hypothetical protein